MAETDAVLRLCGAMVRHWRGVAGISQGELGAAANYSLDMVSSIEVGRRAPSARFLAAAEALLGARGTIAVLEEHVRARPRPLLGGELADVEARAAGVGYYAPSAVPVVLRTEAYAAALRSSIPLRGTGVEAAGERRAVLERGVPLSFVLEEGVLRRPVGGRAVWREQLLSLGEAAWLPHVSVQVVPWDSEEHAGLVSAVAVAQVDGRTVACVDSGAGVQWVPASGAEHLARQYGELRAQALPPRASRALIEALAADG